MGRYRYHITRWRAFASAVVAMLVTLNGAAEATDVPRAEAAARAIMVVRNMTHPPGFLDGVRIYHDEGVVNRIDARGCPRGQQRSVNRGRRGLPLAEVTNLFGVNPCLLDDRPPLGDFSLEMGAQRLGLSPF